MDKIVQKTSSNTDLRHRTPVKIRMMNQNTQDVQTKQKNRFQTMQAQQKNIIVNLEFRIKRLNEQHEKTKRDLENKIKTLTKQKSLLQYALLKTKENNTNTEKQNIITNVSPRNLMQSIRGIDNGYRMENLKKNLAEANMEVSVKKDEIDKLKKDHQELVKIDDEKTKQMEKLKLQVVGLRKNIQELKKQIELKGSAIDRYEIKEQSRSHSKQLPKQEKLSHVPQGHHHHHHQKMDNNIQYQIKHLELELVKANYKNKGLMKTIDAMNEEFMRNNMVFLNKRMRQHE